MKLMVLIIMLATMSSCGYLIDVNHKLIDLNVQVTQLRCNGAFDMKACTEGSHGQNTP